MRSAYPRELKWKSGKIPEGRPPRTKNSKRETQVCQWHEGMSEWWVRRIRSGVLFDQEVEEGRDYVGVGPWPKEAAGKSLYAAYCFDVSSPMPFNRFNLALASVLRLSRTRHYVLERRTARGRLLERTSIHFWDVGSAISTEYLDTEPIHGYNGTTDR